MKDVEQGQLRRHPRSLGRSGTGGTPRARFLQGVAATAEKY